MAERETGRPRGFGFVTYNDRLAVEAAIGEMNNVELDGRIISVNRAEPRPSIDESYGSHGRTAPRGGYRDDGPRGLPPGGRDRDRDRDRDECFKCGHPGHWARDCPSSNGGGGGSRGARFTPPPARYGGGGGGGGGRGTRGDRFGGPDRYGADRFIDDRYDVGPYDDRDRMDRYGGGRDPRDRYVVDRYGPPPFVGDRFAGERYGDLPDRYPQDGYGKERGYERDFDRSGSGGAYYRDAPRGGGGYERNMAPPRMGGGPMRYEGGGNYRDRPRPYDRPRGGRSNYGRY